jgi:tetratricopeptide (TPR) repeat protein
MAPPQPAEPSEVASLLMQALALHQAGQLAAAQKIYVQILAIDPDQFDARHLLGFICHQSGDSALPVHYIDLALPENSAHLAKNNRGITSLAPHAFRRGAGERDRAWRRGWMMPVHSNRSVTLFELKRFAEALASGDRAIAQRPIIRRRSEPRQRLERAEAVRRGIGRL